MESTWLLPMVYAALAGCSWVALGLSYKLSERLHCRSTQFTLVFTLIAGVLTLGKSLFEHTAWSDPHLWGMGLAMGVLLFLAIVLTVRAYALGSAAISWMVVNLSVLVPIFFASLLFREPLYWIDLGILALFILMLLAFERGMRGADGTHPGRPTAFFVTLTLLFFINGTFMFGSKVKEVFFHSTNSAGLCAITYLTSFLIAAVVGIRRGQVRIQIGEWRAGICAGISSSVGFLFFLGAMCLPAIVAFPLGQGISLLGGVLLTAVLYRECITGWKTAGLAMGLLVFLLTGLRTPLTHGFNALHPTKSDSSAPASASIVKQAGQNHGQIR